MFRRKLAQIIPTPLAAYCDEYPRALSEIRALTGHLFCDLSTWKVGRRLPNERNRRLIEAATDGAVPADGWTECPSQ